jgi:hypothetical protein
VVAVLGARTRGGRLSLKGRSGVIRVSGRQRGADEILSRWDEGNVEFKRVRTVVKSDFVGNEGIEVLGESRVPVSGMHDVI